MDQIPFFPKIVTYAPIGCGIFLFFISFSKKQHEAMVENLGENTARKSHILFRYGGPVLILIGIVQYVLRDF